MKKLLFQFILTILLLSPTYGQDTSAIDSLRNEFTAAKSDTAKLSLSNKLAREYFIRGDSISAFKYGYISLALARKTKVPLYRAKGNQIMGYLHTILIHMDSAKYYNNQVVQILKSATSAEEMRVVAYAKNNLAANYHVIGQLKKAVELLIENLPIFEKIKDNRLYHVTLENIAATFNELEDYEKATFYILKGIDFLNKNNFDPEHKIGTYLIGTLITYGQNDLVLMKTYLDKVKLYLDQVGTSTLYSCRYYAYLTWYYVRKKDLKKSRAALAQAEKALKNLKSRTNYYDFYNSQYEVAYLAGDNKTAQQAAFTLYNMAKEDDRKSVAASHAQDVALMASRNGDYKTAYTFQKRYSVISDSTKYENMEVEIQNLEINYQTAEKEKRIALLENEQREVVLKSKNQVLLNLVLGIGALTFLLVMLFLFYVLRTNKKNNRKRLEEIGRDQELKISQALLEGEDRERIRIARDLHDGIGGTLSGIKLKLSDPTADRELMVQKANEQLHSAIGELRRTARGMMPESLLKNGLETALHDLCTDLISSEVQIEFQSSGLSDHSMNNTVHIYRIVQELLTNAIKHGKAKNILVQLIQEQDAILITVDDNGKGFDTGQMSNVTGIGLKNIQNRVDFLKGTLSIDSDPGNGTSVNIEIYVR
ncbi:ATP-binding protein [Sphingobacterium sp. ML3W]|uniref:ATP-binding protein n=1 Tax=Sphingobacterium sp. ML3W TaxID=1538644 RepID=UPI00249BC1D8|nr:ATP-binding protein [Sphingobacterium sp. ML3W]WFA81305.1 ATP-binding protein [Sphingobacterium sp. ML3W]